MTQVGGAIFTGIVETTGRVIARERGRLGIRPIRPLRALRAGESVSVDGVCLTVESLRGGEAVFSLLPETRRVTTLGGLRTGDEVNLERALRAGDRLGGHLLLGHVDGRGRIAARTGGRSGATLEIRVPPALTRWLVPKGPIAVDGVSLTLDERMGRGRIRVDLVAHTLAATTLGRKRAGDPVNLEVDPVAKYLRGMLR